MPISISVNSVWFILMAAKKMLIFLTRRHWIYVNALSNSLVLEKWKTKKNWNFCCWNGNFMIYRPQFRAFNSNSVSQRRQHTAHKFLLKLFVLLLKIYLNQHIALNWFATVKFLNENITSMDMESVQANDVIAASNSTGEKKPKQMPNITKHFFLAFFYSISFEFAIR